IKKPVNEFMKTHLLAILIGIMSQALDCLNYIRLLNCYFSKYILYFFIFVNILYLFNKFLKDEDFV
ncbi:hypothetical protein K4P95_11240, partial [Staphylococcus epidermidis]|nr:hypothetical protein [Staphylococcus epidermidis]